jgi:hypothetical protein
MESFMKLAYCLSSTSPKKKTFKIGVASLATAGVPVLVSQTGSGGIVAATTTGGVDCLGVTLDTGIYTTTQSTTMVEGTVNVLINPDAVYAALMSGAAAAGTALATTTNSAANSAGTTITITTGDPAPNSPTMLDGVAYCIAGNNVGLSRKITGVAATTATLVVPFPFTISTSDVFILSPFNLGGLTSLGGTSVTLTTLLDQVRGDLASTTAGFTARHVEVVIDTQGAPRTNSYLLTMPFDNVWALNT